MKLSRRATVLSGAARERKRGPGRRMCGAAARSDDDTHIWLMKKDCFIFKELKCHELITTQMFAVT